MVKSFFITIVALLFSTFLFGQGTPEELVKKAWPNAYADFGKDLKSRPLNFIFVLDISDETFGDDIKKIVKDFLKPVKEGDYFNVILLGSTDRTSNLTECAIVKNNSKKNSIIQQIDNQVFGRPGSDGLKMTDLVLNALNCTGAENATPIIFIFSDFVHYDIESKWSNPGSEFWQPLITKYDNLKKNINNPYVYCIELPNVNRKPQYLNYIKNIFNDLTTVTCTDPNLLDDKFNNIKGQIIKTLLKEVITDKADLQKKNIILLNNGGAIELKKGTDSLIYNKLILNEESEKKVAEILKSDKLFSFFPPSDTQIEVSGTLVAEKYKSELPELVDVPLTNHKISLMTADSLIPWWLTDIIVIFLIITLYQIFSTLKKRKFIGDIYFYPPRGFQGSFKNIDANLNGISSAIVGENIAVSSYGKAIDVENNLGSNTQFTLKAKKKFFGPKVIEIKSLSGFPLDVISVEKKIRIISPGTKPKSIKPGSVWRINNVEITLPRVK